MVFYVFLEFDFLLQYGILAVALLQGFPPVVEGLLLLTDHHVDVAGMFDDDIAHRGVVGQGLVDIDAGLLEPLLPEEDPGVGIEEGRVVGFSLDGEP